MAQQEPKTGVEMTNAQLNAIRLLLRAIVSILLIFPLTLFVALLIPVYGAIIGIVAFAITIEIGIRMLRATE